MLNAHANSNITCTQTMCPTNTGPWDTVDGTLTFLCFFSTATTTTTSRRLFVEELLATTGARLVFNAMTVDRVDRRGSS